ncbi:MAG: hypothetical protein JO119_09720 [Acidobacteria bacterium]|nr:hypothetical protein [Acidobacteriota bacterium]
MANVPLLYWLKEKKAVTLTASPFKSEQESQHTIFKTPAILGVLGDIYPLKRQVRGGSKPGIPDIVGIDSDGAVCVIEMKNTDVDAGVIPQVLQYAIWAETNPDSIKSLWLEAADRPDGVTIDWEHYAVRILVIAPSIDRTTLENVNKIDYTVDLLEIARWSHGKESWLLVNKLEAISNKRVRPVSGLRVYDRAVYETLYNPKSVPGFLTVCEKLQEFTARNKWPIETKFNKHYFGCKIGNNIVFGVKWLSSRSYALFFKVPEPYAHRTKVQGFKMQRYGKLWHEAIFPVTAENINLKRFVDFFQTALEQRMD